MNTPRFDFFLSYARERLHDSARPLVNELEKLKFNIWIDKDNVLLGSNIIINFQKILQESQSWIGAIIILDDYFCKKNWCQKELDYFLENSIPVFPLVDVPWSFVIEFEPRLEHIEYEKINRKETEIENIHTIVDRIIEVYLNYKKEEYPDVGTIKITEKKLYPIVQDYLNSKYDNEVLILTKAHNVANFILASIAKKIHGLFVYESITNKTTLLDSTLIPRDMSILFTIIDSKYEKALLLNHKLTKNDVRITQKSVSILLNYYAKHYNNQILITDNE